MLEGLSIFVPLAIVLAIILWPSKHKEPKPKVFPQMVHYSFREELLDVLGFCFVCFIILVVVTIVSLGLERFAMGN